MPLGLCLRCITGGHGGSLISCPRCPTAYRQGDCGLVVRVRGRKGLKWASWFLFLMLKLFPCSLKKQPLIQGKERVER